MIINFNFLMGFTYGHFYCLNSKVFFPFTDPEIGFDIASHYIGFERKLFVTDKAETFLKALRFYLSINVPVRLSIDWAILANQKRFLPHSILLVGYDALGFYYYETTQKDRFIEGTSGLKFADQYLIEGVAKVSNRFSYPWKYAFTIFEKSIKCKTNHSELWKRNGELLRGKEYVHKSKKSLAEIFISEIKASSDLRPIKWKLKLKFASYSRRDNSRFLKEYFLDRDIEKTVKLFREASEFYEKTLELIKAGKSQSEEIWDFLDNAESLEKKAGLIFINKSKSLFES